MSGVSTICREYPCRKLNEDPDHRDKFLHLHNQIYPLHWAPTYNSEPIIFDPPQKLLNVIQREKSLNSEYIELQFKNSTVVIKIQCENGSYGIHDMDVNKLLMSYTNEIMKNIVNNKNNVNNNEIYSKNYDIQQLPFIIDERNMVTVNHNCKQSKEILLVTLIRQTFKGKFIKSISSMIRIEAKDTEKILLVSEVGLGIVTPSISITQLNDE